MTDVEEADARHRCAASERRERAGRRQSAGPITDARALSMAARLIELAAPTQIEGLGYSTIMVRSRRAGAGDHQVNIVVGFRLELDLLGTQTVGGAFDAR